MKALIRVIVLVGAVIVLLLIVNDKLHSPIPW